MREYTMTLDECGEFIEALEKSKTAPTITLPREVVERVIKAMRDFERQHTYGDVLGYSPGIFEAYRVSLSELEKEMKK